MAIHFSATHVADSFVNLHAVLPVTTVGTLAFALPIVLPPSSIPVYADTVTESR